MGASLSLGCPSLLLRVKGGWGQAWLHLGQAGVDKELRGQGQGQSGHSTLELV